MCSSNMVGKESVPSFLKIFNLELSAYLVGENTRLVDFYNKLSF